MKKDRNDNEFVNLIQEDETRDYKNLRKELKEKLKEEVVVPIEKKDSNHKCNCEEEKYESVKFSNPTILIMFLLSLFTLGVGTVIGKLYLTEEKKCEVCEDVKCDNIEYDNFYSNDIYLNNLNDIDSFFDNTFLSVESDARRCFIDSTNCYAMDEFKVAYVMANNFRSSGIVKYEVLNKEVKKVFNSGLERENFYMTMMFDSSIINVICTNDLCTYDIVSSMKSEHPFYKYVIKDNVEDKSDYKYVIYEYYVVPGVGSENDKFYNEENGELLFEGNIENFDYKQYLDKLNTYEFKFNSNFKFVESKIVK